MYVLFVAVFYSFCGGGAITSLHILFTFNLADVTSNFHVTIFVIVEAGIIIDMKYVNTIINHFGIKFIAPSCADSLDVAINPEAKEHFQRVAILFFILCISITISRVANLVKIN
jgi:site-specific recombinase